MRWDPRITERLSPFAWILGEEEGRGIAMIPLFAYFFLIDQFLPALHSTPSTPMLIKSVLARYETIRKTEEARKGWMNARKIYRETVLFSRARVLEKSVRNAHPPWNAFVSEGGARDSRRDSPARTGDTMLRHARMTSVG